MALRRDAHRGRSGYSRWGDLAVTRWREDATRDEAVLTYFFATRRAEQSGRPAFRRPARSRRIPIDFDEDRVEIIRRDGTLTTSLEVLVSAEDDAEVRRVSSPIWAPGRATSRSPPTGTRSGAAERRRRPSRLREMFVETEYLRDFGAIVATRRKRRPSEPEIWAAHLSVADGEVVGSQTSKPTGRFPRPRTRCRVRRSRCWTPAVNQFGRDRARSDLRVRRHVRVAPGATVRVAFWTMAAGTALALWTVSINIGTRRPTSARRRWLGPRRKSNCITSASIRRSRAFSTPRKPRHLRWPRFASLVGIIRQGSGPQSGLWLRGSPAISDRAVANRSRSRHLSVVRQILQAHEYWRIKQLAVDLVILNERKSSYVRTFRLRSRRWSAPVNRGRHPGKRSPARAGYSFFGRT